MCAVCPFAMVVLHGPYIRNTTKMKIFKAVCNVCGGGGSLDGSLLCGVCQIPKKPKTSLTHFLWLLPVLLTSPCPLPQTSPAQGLGFLFPASDSYIILLFDHTLSWPLGPLFLSWSACPISPLPPLLLPATLHSSVSTLPDALG